MRNSHGRNTRDHSVSCSFETIFYDYLNGHDEIFRCKQIPIGSKKLCLFHDDQFINEDKYSDNKQVVANRLSRQIKYSILNKSPLYCIGYNIPDIKLKHVFEQHVNFYESKFQEADFKGAKFLGGAIFLDSLFSGKADFSETSFSGQSIFAGCHFMSETDFSRSAIENIGFSGAIFSSQALFIKTIFGKVNFSNAHFMDDVGFHESSLSDVNFYNTVFSGESYFEKTEFSDLPTFDSAVFSKQVFFNGARFTDETVFSETTFLAKADFSETTFSKSVIFSGAKLSEISFFKTVFSDQVDFYETVFSGPVDFNGSSFVGEADFSRATFSAVVDFSEVTFSEVVKFYGVTFSSDVYFSKSTICAHFMFDLVKSHKRMSFSEILFLAMVSFNNSVFYDKTVFDAVDFSEEASFDRSSFQGEVDFMRVKFLSKTIFTGTVFSQKTHFVNCTFANNHLTFFNFVTFEKPTSVVFEIENMSFVSFLNSDITKIKFASNTRWGKKDDLKVIEEVWFDKLSNNELLGKEDQKVSLEDVLSVYRNLRENYEFRLRFSDAGRFFIKEMELKRKNKLIKSQYELEFPYKKKNWAERNISLTGLYYHLSRYGEDILRPTILGIGLIVISTLLLAIQFNSNTETISSSTESLTQGSSYLRNDTKPIGSNTYTIGTLDLGDINSPIEYFHLYEIDRAFERSLKNFIPFLPFENSVDAGLADYLMKMVGGIVTFGLIVIALRRRFERKYTR